MYAARHCRAGRLAALQTRPAFPAFPEGNSRSAPPLPTALQTRRAAAGRPRFLGNERTSGLVEPGRLGPYCIRGARGRSPLGPLPCLANGLRLCLCPAPHTVGGRETGLLGGRGRRSSRGCRRVLWVFALFSPADPPAAVVAAAGHVRRSSAVAAESLRSMRGLLSSWGRDGAAATVVTAAAPFRHPPPPPPSRVYHL